jgi:catechol 2,3-dioxygenase-like lactoylglutathione lyase family enzyme
MVASIRALRCVDLGVTRLAEQLRFYTEVWGLDSVAGVGGVHYLRGTGQFHHILSLRVMPRAGLIRVVFEAAASGNVDALCAQVRAHGISTIDPPAALSGPGGGYGFGFQDPEGRNYAVVCGVRDHADAGDRADRPRKLSHVNLNTTDNDVSSAVLTKALGLRLSDETKMFRFLRCNTDHHSMVMAFGGGPTLNHIAFEMPDLDSVMRGAGRMRDHGFPIEWGPGRHGPGNNVFCYFVGPEEIPIEYTGEMMQVDETYRTGMPPDWIWPPRRVDRWGISDFPSARVHRAQTLFRFTDDGYRLDR